MSETESAIDKPRKHSFETFVVALKHNKMMFCPNNERITIPRDFVIPKSNNMVVLNSNYSTSFQENIVNDWPTITHGLKLGMKVQFIRTRNLYNSTEERNMLKSIGFIHDPRNNRTKLLIQTFKYIYGHLDVPKNYKVPHGDTRYEKGELYVNKTM